MCACADKIPMREEDCAPRVPDIVMPYPGDHPCVRVTLRQLEGASRSIAVAVDPVRATPFAARLVSSSEASTIAAVTPSRAEITPIWIGVGNRRVWIKSAMAATVDC